MSSDPYIAEESGNGKWLVRERTVPAFAVVCVVVFPDENSAKSAARLANEATSMGYAKAQRDIRSALGIR